MRKSPLVWLQPIWMKSRSQPVHWKAQIYWCPHNNSQAQALAQRLGTTLGETLDNLPGVANTTYGPNVGRPSIRGMDGDRVRILQNSGANMDVSGLSFDHAVPIDPLTTERIEVLRGPATLLYGGSVSGGVVNVIDNRIARDRAFDAQGGVMGKAEVRAGGAANERKHWCDGGDGY
jgi:iron complex outermembrane receptor protein